MLTDKESLDNTQVEIGSLQIWYEINPKNISKVAQEMSANVRQDLFKGYTGEYYSEREAYDYVNKTIWERGLNSKKPHFPPCENGLFYWACDNNELDEIIAASRKINNAFYYGLNLPSPDGPFRDEYIHKYLLKCSPTLDCTPIATLLYSAMIITSTVKMRQALEYFKRNMYDIPRVQRYDANPLPDISYPQFVEWYQGKGITRLKKGGSNPETDKIKATEAACEFVFEHNIVDKFREGELQKLTFREMVQDMMAAQDQTTMYQQSAVDRWFASYPPLLPYKKHRGRPRKDY